MIRFKADNTAAIITTHDVSKGGFGGSRRHRRGRSDQGRLTYYCYRQNHLCVAFGKAAMQPSALADGTKTEITVTSMQTAGQEPSYRSISTLHRRSITIYLDTEIWRVRSG